MAIVIKPDGTREEMKGENEDGSLSLEQMQKTVGGYIEMFVAPDGTIFVGNEEAQLISLEPNLPARSVIAKAYGQSSLDMIQNIRGNIIIVTEDEEGNVF